MNAQRVKEIFGLVISGAAALVALAKVWDEVYPRVKTIIQPLIDDAKKITESNDEDSELLAIEE